MGIAARFPLGDRACPARDHEAGFPRLRRARHQPDDPAERTRAVKRALRPFEDLDPLHVGQPEVGIGGVVGQAQVAEILAHGRLCRPGEARIRDAADEQLVAPAAEIGRADGGGALRDLFGAAHPARFQPRAIEQGHLPRGLGIGEVALGGGDDDRGALGLGPGLADGRGDADHARLPLRARPRNRARRRGDQPPGIGADPHRLHPARPRELPHRRLRAHPAFHGTDTGSPQGRVGDDDARPRRAGERNRDLGHRACRDRQLDTARRQRRCRGSDCDDGSEGEKRSHDGRPLAASARQSSSHRPNA